MTEDPPAVADNLMPQVDTTPSTMLGPENITTQKALNFDSANETMQAIMDQAKQNEQRLENMMAENEHLRQDLALEVAKSQQAARQDLSQPLRKDGRRPRV